MFQVLWIAYIQWVIARLVSCWRHQMETFSALLALCVGNSPVTGEFPSQRPVTWSFDVFFDLCLNKWLSDLRRQSCSLWRQCNVKWCPSQHWLRLCSYEKHGSCIEWIHAFFDRIIFENVVQWWKNDWNFHLKYLLGCIVSCHCWQHGMVNGIRWLVQYKEIYFQFLI